VTVMFAYGSNLCVAQMALRCPAARPLGRMVLRDWRLVFRGVADIVPEHGAVCHGGVWRISPACEYELDRYEGVSRGLYRREYIPIKPTALGEVDMLVYLMNSTGVFPPSKDYLSVIREGYRDFGMKRAARAVLAEAVRAAWADKAPSHIERQRYRRDGRPGLAEGGV
jgi:gamma-glutamylcyclotransferase (GGCT)/AIG2-like uncharacterized protein YtfP